MENSNNNNKIFTKERYIMIRRYISYLSAGIIFVSIGFLAGYLIGNMFCERESNAAVNAGGEVDRIENITASGIINTPETVKNDMYYMLKFNDDKLCIYEISGETSRLVKALKCNIDIYPEMDREELRNGITKKSLDEALAAAENFTN